MSDWMWLISAFFGLCISFYLAVVAVSELQHVIYRHRDRQPKGIHDTTVRLTDIAVNADIKGVRFTGCRVEGPAVCLVKSTIVIYNNVFQDGCLWELVDEQTSVIGALQLEDCEFRGCTFVNVGFAGHSKVIAEIRAGIRK